MNYLFDAADTLPVLDVLEWSDAEAVEIFKRINAHWLGDGLTLEKKE